MPTSEITLQWGLLLFLKAFAQAQTVSSTWKKPSISIPPEQQRAIAEAALNEAISNLGPNGQFGDDYINAGNLYSQMAEFDLATGGTKYRDVLKDYFNFAQAGRPKFADSPIQDALAYGYAAARAFVTYGDTTFLQHAEDSWSFGSSYTMSENDIRRGNITGKTFDLQKECQGTTLAGGTFADQTPDDPLVFTDSTAAFFTVSALLAEATSNRTYSDAALLSFSFIRNQLYSSGNIAGAIFVGRNSSCIVNYDQRPSHAGLFIEGLGILSAVSQDGNLDNMLRDVIPLSIANPTWQGMDGVIAQGALKTGDLYMVRGMRAVLARNRVSTDLAAYMKAYMAVQYNAVLDIGNSNIYGQSWVIPNSSSSVDPVGQTNAIGVLVDVFSVNATSVADPLNSSRPLPAPASGKRSVSIGAVIGGVVGGIAFVVFLVSAYVLRRRRLTKVADRKEPKLAPYTLYPRLTAAPNVNKKHTVGNDTSTTSVVSPDNSSPPPNAATSTNIFAFNIAQQGEPLVPLSTPSTVVQRDEPDVSEPRPTLAQFDEQVSTADLVRLLQARLQPTHWRDSAIPPPSYHQADSQA